MALKAKGLTIARKRSSRAVDSTVARSGISQRWKHGTKITDNIQALVVD